MGNFEELQEGLLSIYEMEAAKASEKGESERAEMLYEAINVIQEMETKTDLLLGLTEKSVTLLRPIREVEKIGCLLKDSISGDELRKNGIWMDELPEDALSKDNTYLFINSGPNLKEGVFNQDVSATFIGRWYLDVKEADVTLLHGAHARLWGARTSGQCLAENASLIRLQDKYYQPIRSFFGAEKFRELETLLEKVGRFVIMEHLTPDFTKKSEFSLTDLSATLTHVKGDECLTVYGEYALVRNEWNRSYDLYGLHDVGEVIDRIKATDCDLYLSDDLKPLLVDQYREQFLKLPNERMVIGQNTQGEDVTLSFNANTAMFTVENLCPRHGGEDTKRETRKIPMDLISAPKEQIASIQTRFADRILPLNEQVAQRGLKR